MQLRKATKTDCPQIMDLVRELAVFEKAPDAVTVSLAHFQEAGFGKNPVWEAIVAENEDGKIIGISLWYIRYSTWKGTRLYLEDLIVAEAYRGKGVGKQLFESTIAEARRLKVSGMMWQVLDWNQPAIDFYEKYGTEFSNEWVNCSLGFNEPA